MAETTVQPTAQRGRPLGRTVLPGAAMVAVTFGLARYGYGLLLPEMRAELSLSPGAAGLISSASYASYLLANLAVVGVSGRFGPRVAVGLAAGTAAVGMALVAVATSTPLLALGVLVAGAAAGFAFPPYADLVARDVREERRDVAWSAISSGTGWGVALAGPVAILAGAHWRTAWLVFVGLAVVVGLAAVLLAPGRSRAPLRRPQLSWTWFLCPRSGPLLLSAVLVGTGSAVWWSFSVDALRDAGLDPTAARVVYAVCGVAGVVASLSGVVLSRTGLRVGYLTACVALAASLALLAVGTGQLPVALAAAVLFGTCYNAVIAAHGIWSSRVFADHPAAGLAAVNSALTVGTLLGPVLAGLAIAQVGYGWTLLGAAVVVLAALLCSPPGRRRQQALAGHHCRATPVRP
ncbi:MFS transporter [Desertihabitans brevis]|uniref:MFS transporter n=1 Tax=Desertihabitans brevis TaxID=2268447 RepID=A0A367YYM9_9ACTN|nr:MFS transporter [Desertihabitans brevis]RCK70950.1 MFS transporter [Desertihabitans brevis]